MSVRVAIVAHHALGGSGVMAVEWARLLADRGHDVHLFRTGPSARDSLARCTDASPTPARHRVTAPEHPVLDGPSELTAVAGAIAAEHAKAPFDIVHVHYALPFSLLVPLLQRAPRPPACIVSLHGSDVTGVGADPTYAPALTLAVSAADAVTAPSAWLAAEAVHRRFAAAERVHRLPNFVELDHFVPGPADAPRPLVRDTFGDENAQVVLHVSNFRAVKRAGDAVQAVKRLRETMAARLVLVGDGPERPHLEELAREALGDAVHFTGALDDPAPWLREADAFVLPSESESFGLAALEALATGTPVVASEAGGLPEWLDGCAAARLCPVGDVDAIAGALAELLSLERGALSSDARAWAERCGDPEAAAPVLEDLYERLRPLR